MAGRYDFQSRFGGGSDPWFRAGSVDVTTTTAVVGLGLMQVLVRVVEGPGLPISRWFVLNTDSVLGGEIWRIATWPMVNYFLGRGLFWSLLLMAFFWIIGSQLEGLIGRVPFLRYLIFIGLGSSLILVVLSLVFSFNSLIFGLRYLELGILAAFAVQFPSAQFMFGIPARMLAGFIIGIELFQDLADRQWGGIIMVISSVVLGLIGLRALGHGNEAEWIPKVTIPGLSPAGGPRGTSTMRAPRVAKSKRSRGRNKAGLAAVPTPRPSASPTPESSAEIDALLDKIAESGYDSLTKPEKARLEAHSKQMRRRNE